MDDDTRDGAKNLEGEQPEESELKSEFMTERVEHVDDPGLEDPELTEEALEHEIEGREVAGRTILLPHQIIEMIKKGQKIPQEILDKQKKLQDFTLSFIKSILRTAYYDTAHPESKAAKKGLYVFFTSLMEGKRELTFLIRKSQEQNDVLLDGYLDEPTTLMQIMSKNMADIFVPKFLEYFDRKALRSVSIKTTIAAEEFESFIDIMSEIPVGGAKLTVSEEREYMIRMLEERRILSVTAIFEEDILGKKRRLPWRVELAISRLCKDLRMLPIYRETSLDNLHRIKLQIFADIFRPLRRPDVLAEVLINSDLIHDSIATMPELADLDVELEIIRILPHRILLLTGRHLTKLYRDLYLNPRARYGFTPDILRDFVKKLLIKFAVNILEDRPPEGDVFLEILYKEGVISFHELPQTVQNKINTQQLTDYVQSNLDECCEMLMKPTDEDDYRVVSEPYATILPELLARQDLKSIARLHTILNEHYSIPASWFPERSPIAAQILDTAWTQDNLARLSDLINTANKEDRFIATEIIVSREMQGWPHLYRALVEAEDKWVRKNLLNALIKSGKDAGDFLIARLHDKNLPWYVYRNILYLLTELSINAATEHAIPFVKHEMPQVQVEALSLIAKFDMDAARPYLLEAMNSQHVLVKRKAIDMLSRIKISDPAYTSPLLHGLLEETTPDNELVQIAICYALARLGNITMPNHESAETILHKAILKDSGTGFLASLKSIQFKKTPKVQAAIAYALGVIGTKKSKRLLNKLCDSKIDEVSEAARQAVSRLTNRL